MIETCRFATTTGYHETDLAPYGQDRAGGYVVHGSAPRDDSLVLLDAYEPGSWLASTTTA